MLAFHVGVPFLGGGYVGVDVFFVISGFLITGLLLRDTERAGSTGSKLAAFYARRARRILPAAMVVIAATLIGAAVLANGIVLFRAADDARAAALFTANFRFVNFLGYFGPQIPSLFNHYWSLSVEEQFYVFWPLLLFAITAIAPARARTKALVAVVSLISLASFGLGLVWAFDGSWHSANPSRAFYLLPTRAWELGLGVLVAIAVPQLTKLDGRVRTLLAPAGLVAIAISVITFKHVPFPAWAALLPTFGTAAMIVAGVGAPVRGVVGRLLSNPVAQRVGLYSFSLYLWHWPVIRLVVPHVHAAQSSWIARLAVTLAVSVPASVVTFHVVENPVRYARVLRGHSIRTVGLAAVAIVAFVAAAPVVQDRADTMVRGRGIIAATDAVVATPFVPANLTPSLTAALNIQYLNHSCDGLCHRPATSGTRIVLLGDSHAEHIAAPLAAAAKALHATLTAYMRPACGWFGLPTSAGKIATQCNGFVRNALAEITANPPALVVLSGQADWAQGLAVDEWADHVRATLAAIPKPTKVVVVSQTPYGPDAPTCLADHKSTATVCDRVWPTAFNAQLQQLTAEAGATFVDLKPKLCTGEVCPVIIGNRLVWTDAHHLTKVFAATLAPFFTEQLRPVLPS